MHRVRAGAVVIATMLSAPAPAATVAHTQQALLLLRVLAYDSNLAARAGSDVTVLILYRRGDASSESVRETMASTLTAAGEKVEVSGAKLEVRVKAFTSAADLAASLGGVDAVYLCPGLEGAARDIARVTRSRRVLSFGGGDEIVRAGIGVAFVTREGKPAIAVNLPATKQEGADLDAALLRVAEVMR